MTDPKTLIDALTGGKMGTLIDQCIDSLVAAAPPGTVVVVAVSSPGDVGWGGSNTDYFNAARVLAAAAASMLTDALSTPPSPPSDTPGPAAGSAGRGDVPSPPP